MLSEISYHPTVSQPSPSWKGDTDYVQKLANKIDTGNVVSQRFDCDGRRRLSVTVETASMMKFSQTFYQLWLTTVLNFTSKG